MSNPLNIDSIKKEIHAVEESKRLAELEAKNKGYNLRQLLIERYYNLLLSIAKDSLVKHRIVRIELLNDVVESFGGEQIVLSNKPIDDSFLRPNSQSNKELFMLAYDRIINDLDSAGYQRTGWHSVDGGEGLEYWIR